MTISRKSANKVSLFAWAFINLAIGSSCSDDIPYSDYDQSERLNFGIVLSDGWDTASASRSSDKPGIETNITRLDNSEWFLISSSEHRMDSTIFDTTERPYSRAEAVTGSRFHDSFGVDAYVYSGTDWTAGQKDATSYFTNEKVTKSETSGIWTPSSTKYWPGKQHNIRFFAYAPYDITTIDRTGKNPRLTYTVPSLVQNQNDVVVAVADAAGNYNQSLNLEFKHILTAVKIKVAAGITGTVKRVALKNIRNTGNYTFGAYGWTNTSGNSTFEIKFDPGIELNPDGTMIADGDNTFMMIPQTLTENAVLEVTYTDNGQSTTLSGKLSGKIDWQMGHTVVYRISKTDIEYEFAASDLTDFDGKGETKDLTITSYKIISKGQQTTEQQIGWTNEGFYVKNADGTYTSTADPNWIHVGQVNGTQTLTTTVKAYPQVGEGPAGTGRNPNSTVDSPDTELQAKSEQGTETIPVNLAGNTGSETTANCYIVNGPGWYKFPIVYGNALKDGRANTGAYSCATHNVNHYVNHLDKQITDPWIKNNNITPQTAELLWQDMGKSAPLIDESSIAIDGDYIKFHIPTGETCVQGNAVIAVKDSQEKIAWSWHIWMTVHDKNDTFTFGDNDFYSTLLGYREMATASFPEREIYLKLIQNESELVRYVKVKQRSTTDYIDTGNAPYFQHGRKDPFPGASLKVSRVDGKYTMEVSQDRICEFETANVSSECTLGHVIQNPTTYYGQVTNNTNWYWYHGMNYDKDNGNETGFKDLWQNNGNKTVYDPCPAGYKIPTRSALDAVSVSNDPTYNIEYLNTGIRITNPNNTSQKFFLQIFSSRGYDTNSKGIINSSSSSITATLYCNETNGSSQAHYLLFSPNQSEYPWLSNGTGAAGRVILPQKE